MVEYLWQITISHQHFHFQVAKGKNTVGYDEYVRQVPRHKRRPRFMKHPSTPDHTLDIPTKRWQGIVKAW